MTEPDPIITLNDAKMAGGCARGIRRWAQAQGFGNEVLRTFLHDGLPASVILATDDEFARRVVALKMERENG